MCAICSRVFQRLPAHATSELSRRTIESLRLADRPDDLNVDGDQNLRVTAVYDYTTPKNVAKRAVAARLDATSYIDFPVILISEIATSVNALS